MIICGGSNSEGLRKYSGLERVYVSESTVRRVLGAEGVVVEGNPPREPVPKTPWSGWLERKPNRIWAHGFTHFTPGSPSVVAELDMISRKWLATNAT